MEKLELEKGDFFLLFTDGIIEAANDSGARFGLERLVRLVETSAELSAGALLDRLKAELAGWAGPAGWADDVTAMVVKDMAVAAENMTEGFEKVASDKKLDTGDLELETKAKGLEYSLNAPEEQ